jgi:hypothetical protein
MGGFSNYASPEESSRWRPFVIAAAVLIAAVAVVYVIARKSASPNAQPAGPIPYASRLQVGDLHLSTAENFVGGRVTYIEGNLVNAGDKTVVGAQVKVIFRNNLGEIVDQQTPPLRVAASPLGHRDWVALNLAPLDPGKNAAFRFAFEHISADWNQGYPEIRFVDVQTR